MDVFEAIWTQRTMRRLDSTREVADADILRCIQAAGKAPNGGGREDARYVVARDSEVKTKIADAYRKAAVPAFQGYLERGRDDESIVRLVRSALYLADHMHEAPAIVIVCSKGAAGRNAPSIFPGVQNFMLAARALGLGTAITTIHLQNEGEIKAALGIPEEVSTYCLIPIGYPLGKWKEAKRKPVTEITYWNRWEQPPPELAPE